MDSAFWSGAFVLPSPYYHPKHYLVLSLLIYYHVSSVPTPSNAHLVPLLLLTHAYHYFVSSISKLNQIRSSFNFFNWAFNAYEEI